MVLALEALAEREQDETLGVRVEVGRRLLDNGKALVDLAEGLLAQGVDLLDVGRDVVVGPAQVGEDGLGQRLVGRVAERDGLLAILVASDGVDAVADDRVVEDVLQGSARDRGRSHEAVPRETRSCRQLRGCRRWSEEPLREI